MNFEVVDFEFIKIATKFETVNFEFIKIATKFETVNFETGHCNTFETLLLYHDYISHRISLRYCKNPFHSKTYSKYLI